MQTLKVVRSGRTPKSSPLCTDPIQIFQVLQRQVSGLDREHFIVLHLDCQRRLVAQETVAIGDLSSAIAHPREVFKGAFLHGSECVILVHNHPSGNPMPSKDDVGMTQRLREAGAILGIDVLDHIIMGDSCYFSFANSITGPGKDRRTRTADAAATYPGGWGEVAHG